MNVSLERGTLYLGLVRSSHSCLQSLRGPRTRPVSIIKRLSDCTVGASTMNDLDDLYGDDVGTTIKDEPVDTRGDAMVQDNAAKSDDEESEEESDSDVEFVITTKPGQKAEPPATKAQPYAAIKIQKPGTTNTVDAKILKKEPVAKLPDVDVDAIAEMDGKSILEVDLESLENKPWRQPGADITEYFNYGFDEFTWTAYCQKQTTLRSEYAPDKVMQGMMGAMDPTMMGAMGGGMMMPPMDPNMMQQMYGSMPMDFMQGAGDFAGQPMPQQGYYNRSGGPQNNGPRAVNSPMPDQGHRDDSGTPMPNIPRGPSQPRNNYRQRGGSSRW